MKKKVTYFSYDGILEPLGNSQVLNYMVNLSKDYEITIFTFEKKSDLMNKIRLNYIDSLCKQRGIIWKKAIFRQEKIIRNLNPLIYLINIFFNIRSVSKLVHSRSFIPAFTSFLISYVKKDFKYIYDMRGYWIEEKVDVSKIAKNGIFYKFLSKLDQLIISRSSHIVTLSNVSKNYISKRNHYNIDDITTIYTCTDLDKFKINKSINNELCFGYVGTTVGWYMFDETLDFISIALDEIPNSRFKIVTRDNKNELIEKINKKKINLNRICITSSDFESIHKEFEEIDISIFFIKQSFSKTASMPTKFGEFLSSGIPCITNSKIGDMDDIIISNKSCGFVIDDFSKDSYNKIIYQLKNNFFKIDSISCRKVANQYFSLEKGSKMYNSIYINLLNEKK